MAFIASDVLEVVLIHGIVLLVSGEGRMGGRGMYRRRGSCCPDTD